MKCKGCGANLEIDMSFCPSCGRENTVAKKHREDMARFTKDYAKTKEEVIGNSKRFNRGTLRVAIVAATIAALALLILSIAFNRNLGYAVRSSRSQKNGEKYISEVQTLMSERDYLELNEFINGKRLTYYYGSEYMEYMPVKNVVRNFSSMYGYILEMTQPGIPISSYGISYIGDSAKSIMRDVETGSEDAFVDAFLQNCEEDMRLMLKTYLKLSEEEIESLPTLTDAQRTILIEEAIKNVKEQ